MPPLTEQERRDLERRGQALFEATGQLARALKFGGGALVVLGGVGACSGLLIALEAVLVGLLMVGVGVVVFLATNYIVSLAEVVTTLLNLQLDQAGGAPAGPARPTPKPQMDMPLTTPREPAEEIPPIPLAGEEETPG